MFFCGEITKHEDRLIMTGASKNQAVDLEVASGTERPLRVIRVDSRCRV
jgi:hypothetical protein